MIREGYIDMVEKWANIENPPSYFISNFGRVFSKKSNMTGGALS